ncbi:MAG: phosphatidate cytidylyltransferase [Luminiphilus sp.]|nr:phosphatidate cytidylyltransferase [Luminiphilus sp.]
MLRERVITGLLLVSAFLATLVFAPLTLQAILFALVATAGAWEWSNLVGVRSPATRALYMILVPGSCYLLWSQIDMTNGQPVATAQPWLAASAFLWSSMLVGLKYYPTGGWVWRQPWIRALMGWVMLTATWLSVMVCLLLSNGLLALFMLILIVVTADIGAYFVGRRFGQHALAEAISPGKTWEGFWGGVVCVIALTLVVWQNLPLSHLHLDLGSLLVLGLATAGASVVGDLTISLLKREVGAKDSGNLLPGHGGVLDRLDSICGAAPVYTLGLLLVGY